MMKKYNQKEFLSQVNLGVEIKNNSNNPVLEKMKKKFFLFIALFLVFGWLGNQTAQAQGLDLCDNESDPLVSSHFSNIVKTENGFVVFGMSAEPAGTVNSVNATPVAVTPENGYNYTGTPRLATLSSSSSNMTQFLLVTTTGLYAWGDPYAGFPPFMKSTSAFAPVALPAGVVANDIRYITAAYKVVVLLTHTGEVYVASRNASNSGIFGVTTPDPLGWNKVRGLGGGYLTDVKLVKATTHAIFAVTNSGDFYTWGDKAALGAGLGQSVIKTPVKMSLPFPADELKSIAMTANSADGNTGSTYYALNKVSKKIYAFGDNIRGQLGIGNQINNNTWTTVKKELGVELTNVEFLNAQDHDALYPSAGAITSDGTIYLWGQNHSSKLGMGNYQSSIVYPRVPNGFTPGHHGTYVSLGGSFTIYTTEENDRFCFAGAKNYGVMGNGTSSTTQINIFDCDDTPIIDDMCLIRPKKALFTLVKHGVFENPRGDGFAEVGDRIHYTFEVTNTGNVPITNISITDPLITVNGGPITLNAGEINSTTFSGTYIITDDDLILGKVYNQATVSGKDHTGSTITENSTAKNPLNPTDPHYPVCPDCTMTEVPERSLLITNPMIYQKVK